MNLDLKVIQRTGYTVLDILSDVGGIQSILFSGMSLLLSIWNYNYLDSYLISQLFKNPTNIVFHAKYGNITGFCIENVLPRKLLCCRKQRKKQIAMEEARKALEKEVDII